MAGLFKSVLDAGKSAMDKYLNSSDPNLVKAVNPKDYAPVPVQDREDCMILYGPRTVTVKKEQLQIFDIVVNSDRNTNSSFSLCRLMNKDEIVARFQLYKHYIPIIMSIDRDLCNLSTLQNLCDALKENETLTIAHLAVQLDLKTVLSHPVTEPIYNEQDKDGQTPIMIAVKRQNVPAIKHLVSKEVDLARKDSKLNNVFHFTATTNKEIIEMLGENPNLLKERNGEGFTPLHIACMEDMPDCVQAFLCAGADVNMAGTMDNETPLETAVNSSNARCVKEIIQMYPKQLHVQDIKNGGTPLHWAKTKEIVVALIEAGCLVDAKNFKGDPALHIMISHDRLDCVMALIANGANVNLKDSDGKTPLHIACEEGKNSIVRALLVFGADTECTNDKNETPWQVAYAKATTDSSIMDTLQSKDRKGVLYSMYAIGAHGNAENLPNFKKASASQLTSPLHKRTRIMFDDILANAAKKGRKGQTTKGGRLLSLDGGGIKGLVLTRMLLSMEDAWNAKIIDCFDWIAGTSTGGILALGLAHGLTVLECQRLYYRLKDIVFKDSKPYPSKPFEDLLQETFGLKKMKDITNPKLVITATLADRSPPDLQLFRNYTSPQDMLGVAEYDHPDLERSPSRNLDMLVWRAARASGAAPSFFRPEGPYVDGGIMSNNPTMDLLTEIAEYNIAQRAVDKDTEVVEPTVCLSLGTGVPPVKKTTVVDIFRPDNAGDTLKLFLNWDGMGKLMLESVLDADGPTVDRCRAWCSSTGTAFFRFSPLMGDEIELDETNDKKLVDLMWSAMVLIHNRREDVEKLKSFLVHGRLPSLSSMEIE